MCVKDLNRNSNGIRTHNHLVRKQTLNYLDWPVWRSGWVFVYELTGCGFKSCCNHVNFRYRACFERGVPWHSGNYRVYIHSETRSWHEITHSHLNRNPKIEPKKEKERKKKYVSIFSTILTNSKFWCGFPE